MKEIIENNWETWLPWNFCCVKDTVRTKRQVAKWENICKKMYLIKKSLLLNIYQELTLNKKTNNLIKNLGQKPEQTSRQQKQIPASKHMKRCSNHVLMKCKLKYQLDTTTYLLQWPKSRTWTIPKAGKDVEQQKLIHGWCECTMVEPLGWQLGGLLTKLNILTMPSSNHSPFYLPIETDNFCLCNTCTWMLRAALFLTGKT